MQKRIQNGISTKPTMKPMIARVIFPQMFCTLDCRMYGMIMGEKKTRKKGDSSRPMIMKLIVLQASAQQPLYSCNASIFTPNLVNPQLVSEK